MPRFFPRAPDDYSTRADLAPSLASRRNGGAVREVREIYTAVPLKTPKCFVHARNVNSGIRSKLSGVERISLVQRLVYGLGVCRFFLVTLNVLLRAVGRRLVGHDETLQTPSATRNLRLPYSVLHMRAWRLIRPWGTGTLGGRIGLAYYCG